MRLPRRHPGREEYERLRAAGVARRVAARQAGVNERTAKDWDWGVKKSRTTRAYADGRHVDYTTGTVTMGGVSTAPVGLTALEKQLHPRFLTLAEREQIRDLHALGRSLRVIGRALGRPASTVKREIERTRAARATSPTRPPVRPLHADPGHTGTLWFDLPERFGTPGGLHSRYKRWAEVGVWDQIMAALPNTGQPVWTPPPLVPPFRVEGRIDPRVLTDADIQAEAVAGETGVPPPTASVQDSGSASQTVDWPVRRATVSKSRSWWSRVRSDNSAVAATSRSTGPAERCSPLSVRSC